MAHALMLLVMLSSAAPNTSSAPVSAVVPAPAALAARAPLAAPRDSSRSRFFSPPVFATLSAAAIASAFSLDRRAWNAWSDSAGPVHRAGDAVSRFGDLRGVGPALLGAFAFGWVTHRPAVTAASVRIGLSVFAAGAASEAVKLASGRSRPDRAPGDPDDFSPFHGADSFPSGHTTVMFAFASALTTESTSRWVPWVAYPAAAVVGAARIADDRHWLSDVVAGAALGGFGGRECDRWLRRRSGSKGFRLLPIFDVGRGHREVGASIQF